MRVHSVLSLGLVAAFGSGIGGGCTVEVATEPIEENESNSQDPAPTDPALHSILSGGFQPLIGYAGIAGRAQLIRTLDGVTRVDAVVTGLPAGADITAHVHVGPCAYQGAGHYKIDPARLDTIEANELWLHIASSPDGIGIVHAEFTHRARGDALSVVVHEPGTGNKMACADLTDGLSEVGFAGQLAPLPVAGAEDQGITGSVAASRSVGRSQFQLDLFGLDPASQYVAHVHALPCAVTDGGGHYKFDPTVVDPIESNEIWFAVGDHPAGALRIPLDSAHALRGDAQSVVLHRTVDDGNPKVACADLDRVTPYPPSEHAGRAVPFAEAIGRGLDLDGAGIMIRTLADITRVTVVMSGLEPDVEYTAHVHQLPCSIQDGGGHYKIDGAVADAAEDNEMWLRMMAAPTGVATVTAWFPFVARSDAHSVVVHEPSDAARLACIDL